MLLVSQSKCIRKDLTMAKTLNDLLDAAIQDEIDAQKFYLGALEKTNNPKLNEFFN